MESLSSEIRIQVNHIPAKSYSQISLLILVERNRISVLKVLCIKKIEVLTYVRKLFAR